MYQFVYVFHFRCYRYKTLNSIVQFVYHFRHENVVDIIQIEKKLVETLFKKYEIFVFHAQNTEFVDDR